MKKIILIILLLNAAITQAQNQPGNFVSLQINGGFSYTQALPMVGMELGARLHNFYVGVQGMASTSKRAGVPAVMSLNGGYNIGLFKPFISYGWQTAGNEAKDIFKPSFQPGAGVTYYFFKLPILITGQMQGKEIILSTGFNINF